jgi:hypothetical protein
MKFFEKKDRCNISHLDNYANKYLDNFKLGLLYVVIGAIAYGIYSLYNYLF